MNETERRRRERSLLAVLLLFGICILLYVGQIAIGIAPNWEVAANMRSNLDPNIDFMTNKNSGIIEPLNPDSLTLPAWLYLFTPNATMPINAGITPPATRVSTQAPTRPATLQPTIASTLPATESTIYVPPPTRPGNKTATPTNIPSVISADLVITKTDGVGVTTYIPGSGINYQIVVTNNGPNNASGFSVTDAVPGVINGLIVGCSTIGTASCGANGSAGNNVAFTGMSVNVGASITITINGTVNAGATGNLVNTASIVIPGGAGFSDPVPANNTATDTDTPIFSANLGITKSDGVNYLPAGGSTTYTIVVSNTGPANVIGATVTDIFPPAITNINWTCAVTGGATCSPSSGITDINGTVDIPVGETVTYTVTGNITADVTNTASVSVPAGYDPAGNASASDTDTVITIDPPPVEIGTLPDGTIYNLGGGGALTLNIPTVVNGDIGVPDLIYYEFPNGTDPGILLDWVIIEIGNGTNWYTVFYWGDTTADTNTNVDFNLLPYPPNPPFPPPEEPDEREIPAPYLYPSPNGYATGVAIDLDGALPLAGIIPPGIYPYLRIYSPLGGVDNKLEIDAIVALP
jgi:uncharacterized repeat protein (TIGR01451 family)